MPRERNNYRILCWRDRFVLLRRYDRIWPSLKILIISSKEGEKERNAIVSINFFIKRVESEIKRLVGKRREEGACDLQQAISLRVAWSRRKSLTCLCYILRKLRFLRLQPSFFFSSFARKSSLFLHLYLVKVAFLSSRNWSERSSERPARGRADYRKVSGGEVSIRVTHILGFRYVLHLRRNDPRVDIPRFQHFWRFEGKGPALLPQWLWGISRGEGRFRVSQDYESLPLAREIARRRDLEWKKELGGNRSILFFFFFQQLIKLSELLNPLNSYT